MPRRRAASSTRANRDASDALVHDIGGAKRGVVTHARRLRWLTRLGEDPMWMVRYAKTASVQGEASIYVPRASLPTGQGPPPRGGPGLPLDLPDHAAKVLSRRRR